MEPIKTTLELEYFLEDMEESKNLVMIKLEEDFHIMVWTIWRVGLPFKDKSPREMFHYIKNPNIKELKTY